MTNEILKNITPSSEEKTEKNTEFYSSSLIKKLYEFNFAPTMFALNGDFDTIITNLIYEISTPSEREDLPKNLLNGGDELWQWLEEIIQNTGHAPKALENIYEGAKESLEALTKGEALMPSIVGNPPELIKFAEVEPDIKIMTISCAKRALPFINKLAKIINRPELELPDLLK